MSKQSMPGRLLTSILHHCEQCVKELLAYHESHPEASFAEMEGKVRVVGRKLLPKMLEAVLQMEEASPERSAEAPRCACGARLRAKGRKSRRQETLVGEVCWEREYYSCAACGRGRYPQDEAWGVNAGAFSEALQSGLARLGAALPFRQAAETLGALTGAKVSPSTAERVVRGRGEALEMVRRQEEGTWLREGSPAQESAEGRWVAEMDAARVRFDDGWHEVKAGVVSELTGGGKEVRALSPSYTATIGGMEAAGKALYGEVVRRGVDPGRKELACVADGAPGNWEQFAQHFPQREEILDWYHAMQHLWAAGNGCLGEGTEEARAWVAARKTELWAGQPERVLAALRVLGQAAHGGAAQGEEGYFTTNRGRMRYAIYRAEGYPMGSGAVESACKRLVAARMKGAGMTWGPSGARAVLRLRAELLSGRWDHAWALTHPARKPPKF